MIVAGRVVDTEVGREVAESTEVVSVVGTVVGNVVC